MPHRFSPEKAHVLESKDRVNLYRNVFKNLLEYIKNKDVADIGCGTGVLTDFIAEHAKKVYALDISDEMIEIAKKRIKNKNVELIKLDFMELKNCMSETFIFIETLHEIGVRAIDKLRELCRDKKIKVIISDWEKKETMHGPPLEDRIDKKDVVEYLRKRSFKIIKIEEIPDRYIIVAELM